MSRSLFGLNLFFALSALVAACTRAVTTTAEPGEVPAASIPNTPEAAQVQKRLAAVRALQGDLRAVVEKLATQQKEAASIKPRIEAVQRKLPPDVLARVMKESGESATASLTDEARALDARLQTPEGPLLDPLPPAPSDEDGIKLLKEKLAQEQRATSSLLEAARVSLRARAVVARMEAALPALEAEAAKAR